MIFGFTALQCYVAIVAIFCVVYLFTSRKNIWFPFVVITVLFSLLAYNLTPAPTDDLVIYYHHIDIFRNDGIDGVRYALEQNWFEWKTYRVSLLYFYFISRLPNNQFLPAITIFIVYGLMFTVLYKAANRFKIKKIYLFFASMFLISTYWYYDVASGVRNGIAFTVAFACAYYHFVEKKHIFWCFVGYVCVCLMHSTGFMPVLLVLITMLTWKINSKIINIILIFGLALGGYLIDFLAEITNNDMIMSIAGRTEQHSAGGSLETGTMFLVNVATFAVVAFIVLYTSFYINNGKFSEQFRKFYKYTTLTLCFLVGCLFSGLIFVRFTRWIIPMIGALYFMIGMQSQREVIQKLPVGYLNEAPFRETIRLRTRGIVIIAYIVYTAVHFWYSLAGSSLQWLHF